jgi:hypothetical protein
MCFINTKSSTVQSFDFNFKKLNLSLYDMGSDIKERKKISLYTNKLSHILFFFSLDDYCFFNENNENKFTQSLSFLKELLSNTDLKKKIIFFIFTKFDILKKNTEKKLYFKQIEDLGFEKNYNTNNVLSFYKSYIKQIIKEEEYKNFYDFFILENGNENLKVKNLFYDILQTSTDNYIYSI